MLLPRIIILFFSFLLFLSCKKENKDEPSPASSNTSFRPRFEDTLAISPASNGNLFATLAGVNSTECFYVLQKINGTSYFLIKTDLNANVTYTRQIDLNREPLQDVCGSKTSEDFFTLTASEKDPAVSTGTFVMSYVYYGPKADSMSCTGEENVFNYEFDSSFDPFRKPQTNNRAELKKFDKSGKEIWNKVLDGNYFTGNSIETDLEGNIYVLTLLRYTTEAREMAFLGGISPYYSFNFEKYTFTLNKFDANGNLLFKTEVKSAHEGNPDSFHAGLALSSNAAYIRTRNNFYRFDLAGKLQSTTKPYKNECYNFVSGVLAHPRSPIAHVTGIVESTSGDINRYFLSLNQTSESNLDTYSEVPLTLTAMDNLRNFYCGGGNTLMKLSAGGKVIYSRYLFSGTSFFYLQDSNSGIDKNNNIYCLSAMGNLIKMYKLDDYGSFN